MVPVACILVLPRWLSNLIRVIRVSGRGPLALMLVDWHMLARAETVLWGSLSQMQCMDIKSC